MIQTVGWNEHRSPSKLISNAVANSFDLICQTNNGWNWSIDNLAWKKRLHLMDINNCHCGGIIFQSMNQILDKYIVKRTTELDVKLLWWCWCCALNYINNILSFYTQIWWSEWIRINVKTVSVWQKFNRTGCFRFT